MKILVTGANGFIGTHLVKRLRDDGHEVFVLHLHRCAVEMELLSVKSHYIKEPYCSAEIDAIYHLAAITGSAACRNDRQAAFDVNVVGTQRLLEFALQKNAQFIYPATADHTSTGDPYSFTKTIAEGCCWHYATRKLRVAVARIYSVYGPGQGRGAIHAFNQQRKLGLPLTVFGDGEQRRDFIHVGDLVDGLARLVPDHVGEFEFGVGRSYSIREVAEMYESPIEYLPYDEVGLPLTLASRTAATQRTLEWRPQVNLEDYIRKTSYVNTD